MSFKRAFDGSSAPESKRQKRKGFQVGPANLPDGTWRRKNQKIKRGLIERAQIKRTYAKLKERENVQPSNVRYDEQGREGGSGQQWQDVRGDEGESDQDRSELEAAAAAPASLELHPDRQQMMAGRPMETSEREHKRSRPREQRWNERKETDKEKEEEKEEEGEEEEGGKINYSGRLDHDESTNDADFASEKITNNTIESGKPRLHSSKKPTPFSKEAREAERRRSEAEQRAKEREEARQARQRKLDERERHRRAMAKARSGGRNGQRKLGRESKVLLDKVKRLMGDGGGGQR